MPHKKICSKVRHIPFYVNYFDVLTFLGFYLDLGSKRLRNLVTKRFEASGKIKDHKVASEMRALILERLPVFLYEQTHARARVSYSWLNNEKHFIVKMFRTLTVTKSLKFGSVHVSHTEQASALAETKSKGVIELMLAVDSQAEKYE